MERCNYCHAELKEGDKFCPQCGKEIGKTKIPAGKAAVACAAVVVVLALVVALVYITGKPKVETAPVEVVEASAPETVPETVPETTAATEAPAPTVPADGNPDDETCKGTYYADAEAVTAARDNVVATLGEQELTISKLQVFYWMEVRNFLTQYGAYASYFGLDYQQPLDVQPFTMGEKPMTWHQYFLGSALNAWNSYASMAAEADAAGYEISEAQRNALENVEQELDAAAQANGFASGLEMLQNSMGAAAQIEDYKYFMELYYKANGYYNTLALSIEPTDEELEAYFDSHAEGYAQSGVTKETSLVDVRHILVYPEGADSASVRSQEFPEEAWTAGEAAAQAILDEWLAGEMTEESFAALANTHSQDPGSNTNGGLYTDVSVGQMVPAFNDWCFDPARQVGDTGVVRTEYGFHVMFFSGSRLVWKETAKNDFVGETTQKMVDEIMAKTPISVKYADILLTSVALT